MKRIVSICFLMTFIGTALFAGGKSDIQTGMNKKLSLIGRYSTGSQNSDGGIAEIVVFNKDNNRIYTVNGALGSLDIVNVDSLRSRRFAELSLYKRIDVNAMAQANGFVFGDLTSVTVSTKNQLLALAVQHSSFSQGGYIVLVNYEGEYIRHYRAGVQPDMITFTPDEKYILTADEGEPREGYGENAIDPHGTVTIVNIDTNEVRIIGFSNFDNVSARTAFLQSGGILNRNINPSLDFEPEYIVVNADSKTAYVALQEANAIAILDIENGVFTAVHGLGFKDHNLPGNSLDVLRDNRVHIETQNLYGVHHPDGIAIATIGGNTYILTANEGDAREWGSGANAYNDVVAFNIEGIRVDTINTSLKDGLDHERTYLYGTRSFSIWDFSTGEIVQVFDSGNEFETRTSALFPDNFNASHTNNELDSRSRSKGPEPEYAEVLTVGNKTYAIIGLERIGGIMVYDISNPISPMFYDYINTRDFSGTGLDSMGDLGPEGICSVMAKDSPTGKPIIFVANEVSGTIIVFELR